MEKSEKDIEGLIYDYLAGELSEEKQKELLAWINADDAHQKMFSDAVDFWAIAHVPYFSAQAKKDFSRYFTTPSTLKKQTSKFFLSNRSKWYQIAAAVLLLFVVNFGFFRAGQYMQKDKETVSYCETTVPMGSSTKMVLPDQSVVWLNAGSTFRYSTDFNKSARTVELKGEAYFEVAHDSLKPFIVKSSHLDIRVLGTHFNVKAYEDEENTQVSLVSGKVHVHVNSDDATVSNDINLYPNEQLSYNKAEKTLKIQDVKGSDTYTWIKGKIQFENQTFDRIAKDLERRFNVHIIIESSFLPNEVFTGSFSLDYSFSDIMREIDMDKKYVWMRKGDTIIIGDK